VREQISALFGRKPAAAGCAISTAVLPFSIHYSVAQNIGLVG